MTISKNLIRFALSFADVFWKGNLLINEYVHHKIAPIIKDNMGENIISYHYLHWSVETEGSICHTKDLHTA